MNDTTIPGGSEICSTTPPLVIDGEHNLMQRRLATPAQCRAARAMLHWTQADLASRAGIARKTVTDMELATRRLHFRTRRDITNTLQQAGIEFLWEDGGEDGPGVR